MSQFSEEWKYFSKHSGVEPLFARVRYPQAKGKVENHTQSREPREPYTIYRGIYERYTIAVFTANQCHTKTIISVKLETLHYS